jgi:hypothetical protein
MEPVKNHSNLTYNQQHPETKCHYNPQIKYYHGMSKGGLIIKIQHTGGICMVNTLIMAGSPSDESRGKDMPSTHHTIRDLGQ